MVDTRRNDAHLGFLDGVRGLAILLVVVPHLSLDGGIGGPPVLDRAIQDAGHGVELFFVLSGFCLALPLLRRVRAGEPAPLRLAAFFFDRAYRIVPMYYLATVLCLLANLVWVHAGRPLPPALTLPHSPWAAIAPLLFLDRGVTPVNANFWSIAVQLRWYAAFPLLFAFFVRQPRLFTLAIAGAWIAYLATRLHAVDVGTIPLFMLGIVAADLHVREHPLRRYALYGLPLAIVLGHLGDRWASMPDPFGNELSWTMQPTTIGWQLAAFCAVVAATGTPWLRRLFAFPPLRWLGIASFSIYLVHEPVLEWSLAILGPHAGLLAGGLALAAGGLVWWAAERPLCAPALRRRVRARIVPSVERLLRAASAGDALEYVPAPAEPSPRSPIPAGAVPSSAPRPVQMGV